MSNGNKITQLYSIQCSIRNLTTSLKSQGNNAIVLMKKQTFIY